MLTKAFPHLDMKFVTPASAPRRAALNDQTRVMTPGEAPKLGIDFIVIGRPITHARGPAQGRARYFRRDEGRPSRSPWIKHEHRRRSFSNTRALLKAIFSLSSGLHSDRYLQCALVLAQPGAAGRWARARRENVAQKPDLVVSPPWGGLSSATRSRAPSVSCGTTSPSAWMAIMVLRRGFTLKPGEKGRRRRGRRDHRQIHRRRFSRLSAPSAPSSSGLFGRGPF